MARTRLLHPEFFRHEEVAGLDPWARLLFQGLWTLADKEGRLEDRPRRIRADIFPYDPDVDVDALLDVLVARGFVVAYEVAGRALLSLPSFARWQNPHPKEKPSEFPGPGEGAIRPRNYMASLENTETSRAVSNTVSNTVPRLPGVSGPVPIPRPAPSGGLPGNKFEQVKAHWLAAFEKHVGESAWGLSDAKALNRALGEYDLGVSDYCRRIDLFFQDQWNREHPAVSVWGSKLSSLVKPKATGPPRSTAQDDAEYWAQLDREQEAASGK